MNRTLNTKIRFQRGAWILAAALGMGLCAAANTAHARGEDNTIFLDTFEADTNMWVAFGPHARLGVTNESGKVKNGKSALAFNYRIDNAPAEAGQPPIDAILRPVADGQLAKTRSISFWARTDVSAPLAVSLSEKGGGRYLTTFWMPKNQWTHVVLTPEDFSLMEGKDDPKDPDGKLDMDQVENIGMINLWSFLAVSVKEAPDSRVLFPPQMGERSLWIDDFTVSRADMPPASPEPTAPTEKSGAWIDPLRRDLPAWIPLGLVDMQIDSKAPTKGRALRLDYTQETGKLAAFVRDLHHLDMSHFDHLDFEAAATKPTKLLLQLEEKSGAKYNATVDIPGDSMPARKAVYFANFTLSDDSPKDPDGKLTLDQIKSLTIIDFTALFDQNALKQQNTLWLGPIRASQSK